ncbi:Aldo/keto reductase [Metarhizium album ARSEF 1941]|uniref:Aldo/keto reductase n=1 Tax=Metarhizium album (strain ARSEF 1941) TaxID=1081103 RepID=A0A0B2X708_METAS|nr:Aldo/keto reductase [Metarhizium album ARSEF 1941]KHO01563.1 Aldo/keto reductase [Metarhizium album ARSEF 1941]
MAQHDKSLSQVLPPLILGTATFNYQYNDDPSQMPYNDIVRKALQHHITAFDTSPYYGPSEVLLGDALRALTPPPDRDGYFLITKAGRIASNEFDYSPPWIRYSVCRSLERLSTPYLDLVYAHDAEFVSPPEVLEAVKELRRLRDQGLVRYVGISGYPVQVLVSLAEMVLEQTGEPLDAVMSYANYSIQNTQLGRPDILERFKKAGVDCIPNASMLAMGLITTRGADGGPMASWHPAPPGLRDACFSLTSVASKLGERIEEIAIRWALENWSRVGSQFGSVAYPPELSSEPRMDENGSPAPIGVTVMGVSNVDELEETWALWKSAVGLASPGDERAAERRDRINRIVTQQMWPKLGSWKDYSWQSGGEAFTNMRQAKGVVPIDAVAQRWGLIPKNFLENAKI